MPKIYPIQQREGVDSADFMFWCPGCKCGHGVWTTHESKDHGRWVFNGNVEKPTISAFPGKTGSILVCPDDPKRRCHSFVTDGVIHYCHDCGHVLAGKQVPMEDF